MGTPPIVSRVLFKMMSPLSIIMFSRVLYANKPNCKTQRVELSRFISAKYPLTINERTMIRENGCGMMKIIKKTDSAISAISRPRVLAKRSSSGWSSRSARPLLAIPCENRKASTIIRKFSDRGKVSTVAANRPWAYSANC